MKTKASKICVSKQKMYGEHKKLVKLLKGGSKKTREKEAADQKKEMRKYK